MDPERIHAYLQAACAGLGMTIGEVWFAQNETGTSTVAKIGTCSFGIFIRGKVKFHSCQTRLKNGI